MIISLALPVLERVTNQSLRLDPSALKKLATISDQVIAVQCTDWQLTFYIVVTKNGLHFERQAPHKSDTTVSGTLPNFLKLLSKGANTIALFEHPISIEGNTHNLEVLRQVFEHLDIDWEEKLSQFLGDVVAHKLCFHTKRAHTAARNARQKLKTNIQEYAHFEARALPTRKEIILFYEEVATLQNDVDRLAARINNIAKQ